ncbi:hypothetical protein BDR26DRAFT_369061 [Obelidium mucronatum]|nr:hypothetical protein BDR26DRAFT_369061 [Obelidium mucronatum]
MSWFILWLIARQHRMQMSRTKLRAAIIIRKCLAIRTRNTITTRSLGNSNNNSWYTLYNQEKTDDASFVASISLTRLAFAQLLQAFKSHYIHKSGPGKRGRPRKAYDKLTVLGLLLCFYTDTSDTISLCRKFCMPPTTLL